MPEKRAHHLTFQFVHEMLSSVIKSDEIFNLVVVLSGFKGVPTVSHGLLMSATYTINNYFTAL